VRAALNLLYLLPGVVGGTETYAAGLIGGFSRVAEEREFVVFVNREAEEWPLPEDGRLRRVMCDVAASNRLARYRFEQARLPRLVREHGVDLLHSLGYVAPLDLGLLSVVAIHDLTTLPES
jgi:hypothetical protein